MEPALHKFGWALWLRLARLNSGWRQRALDERYLADLSDYHLKDIGLPRGDETRDPREFYWRR